MRHQKAGSRLNRTTAHRKATMMNLADALFEHKAIHTTLAKSKQLRMFAEPLITLAKTDTIANRRRVFSRLRSKSAVQALFDEIGPANKDRPGGYTRILKLDERQGDAAPMARIELVGLGEYNPDAE